MLHGEVFFSLADVRAGFDQSSFECTSLWLDGKNPTAVLVPPGVVNGFYVQSDTAVFFYKWCFEGDYPDSFTTYESKACVPKDHCHRFLIGTTKERWGSTRIIDDFESFTLNWDGESLLENFNAYSFDRIDFGQCESKCSSDQSEFEFFITRNQSAYMDGLSWNLTGSDGAELYADSAPDGTASLVHAIECVAKDDCVKFGIGYPTV